KDTQNNRDARRRDVARHDQAKTDSDGASVQSTAGAPIGIAPLAVPQQQIQISARSAPASFSASAATGGHETSVLGTAAGNTKTGLAVEGRSPTNAHPAKTVQPLRGLAPVGLVSAAGGDSVAEDGVHGQATGDHEDGTHDESLKGSGARDGGRGLALPAAMAQATHEAGTNAQAAAGRVAGAPGGTGQNTVAAVAAPSNGAADTSLETVSASRLGRSSNVLPGAGQNPGQAEGRAAQEHEGGVAIIPAVGAAHDMPAGAAAGTPGSSSGNGSEKSSGESFAAMDAQGNGAGLTWVHAGSHQAEAGFQDPALGWVSVRAEMGPGGVHAAIVPGTADAAQALGGHMAGLSAHLAEQRVGVTSVSMNNPGNSPGNNPGVAPQLAGGGAGHSGGGHSNTGQGQHQPADTSGSYATPTVTSVSGARAIAHHDSGTRPVVAASGMTGRHISVVA